MNIYICIYSGRLKVTATELTKAHRSHRALRSLALRPFGAAQPLYIDKK